jgi:hypothetical protein
MFTVAVPSFVVETSREFAQSCNLDGSDGNEQQVVGVIAQNMANLALGRPFVLRSNTMAEQILLCLARDRH